MPKEQFDMLSSKKYAGMFWACKSCTSFAAKYQADVLRFNQRLDALEKKVGEADEVREDVENLKKEFEVAKSSGSLSSNGEVFTELRERESRKNNIVIYELDEPSGNNKEERVAEDEQQLQDLLKDIDISVKVDDDIRFMSRLGKFDKQRKRPLLVGVVDHTTKERILSKAPRLAKMAEPRCNVNIASDLTRKQREEEKGLQLEVKARNDKLTDEENFIWKVIGRRGERRIVRSMLNSPRQGQEQAGPRVPQPRGEAGGAAASRAGRRIAPR